ncbi:MAG: hypothetical protein Fur0018_04960 [Anaerolineales bacterium]
MIRMQSNDTATSFEYKAGFVAVLGRPNVGKSTLMNALLGQKVAAVSPKPQTTRRRQLGILTLDNVQMIFDDTPGLHKPLHKLGEYMNEEALSALKDCDVWLFVVDISRPPNEEDEMLAAAIAKALREQPQHTVLMVCNKADLLQGDQQQAHLPLYQALIPHADAVAVSAAQGENLDALLAAISEHLPVHPPYYDPEQLTDLYERDIAADLIREAALLNLEHEVPHGIAVRIDEFTERGEQGAYIRATIFVERESQKGIVIGKGGAMLKKIGSQARTEIEAMSGRKVFLELRVKVRKNWRDDENVLSAFGYRPTNKQE